MDNVVGTCGQGVEVRFPGSGLSVQGSEFRQGSGLSVQGSEFRQGSGCRVWGYLVDIVVGTCGRRARVHELYPQNPLICVVRVKGFAFRFVSVFYLICVCLLSHSFVCVFYLFFFWNLAFPVSGSGFRVYFSCTRITPCFGF